MISVGSDRGRAAASGPREPSNGAHGCAAMTDFRATARRSGVASHESRAGEPAGTGACIAGTLPGNRHSMARVLPIDHGRDVFLILFCRPQHVAGRLVMLSGLCAWFCLRIWLCEWLPNGLESSDAYPGAAAGLARASARCTKCHATAKLRPHTAASGTNGSRCHMLLSLGAVSKPCHPFRRQTAWWVPGRRSPMCRRSGSWERLAACFEGSRTLAWSARRAD